MNALFASYVPSTVSCASISAIDATEALKMPGVVDFISAADLGPDRNFTQPVITPLKTVLGGRKIFADQEPAPANSVERSRDMDDVDAALRVFTTSDSRWASSSQTLVTQNTLQAWRQGNLHECQEAGGDDR